MADAPPKTFAERLQSVSRHSLFLVLLVVTTIPLWLPFKVPNEPDLPTKRLYAALMSVPEGSTVLIESDWTISTRGESAGQFKALMRILMRRKIKACVYTAADPQAPKVARDVMRTLNEERKRMNLPPYEEWKDWVHLGYFPSAEATELAIAANIRTAFAGRKSVPPGGTPTDVFRSPVMEHIRSIKDIPLFALVTASNTSNIVVERLTGAVPLAFMVTGVMGPETQVYFDSKQLIGLSKGLKGVYDLEGMMENGVTVDGKHYDGFKGMTNYDQGALYYPALHAALVLLILAVVLGNVGMYLSRRKA